MMKFFYLKKNFINRVLKDRAQNTMPKLIYTFFCTYVINQFIKVVHKTQ